jgi:hypothetical protein
MSGKHLAHFIQKHGKILINILKYIIKLNNPKMQSVFGTGWKACATLSSALVHYPG